MQTYNLKTWGGKRSWLVLGAVLLAGCGGGSDNDGIPEEFRTSAACLDPQVLAADTEIFERYQVTRIKEGANEPPEHSEFSWLRRNERKTIPKIPSVELVQQTTVREDVGTGEVGEVGSEGSLFTWRQRPDGVIEWYVRDNQVAFDSVLDNLPEYEEWYTRPCADPRWTLKLGEEKSWACTAFFTVGSIGSRTVLEQTLRYAGLRLVDTPAGRFNACVFHEQERNWQSRLATRSTVERTRWVVRGIDVRVEEHVSYEGGSTGGRVLELQAATINGRPLVP